MHQHPGTKTLCSQASWPLSGTYKLDNKAAHARKHRIKSEPHPVQAMQAQFLAIALHEDLFELGMLSWKVKRKTSFNPFSNDRFGEFSRSSLQFNAKRIKNCKLSAFVQRSVFFPPFFSHVSVPQIQQILKSQRLNACTRHGATV